MNLNVITRGDALRSLSSVKVDPAAPGDIADEQKQTESGKVPQVTADDLYSRLLKYIPGPLIGTYLFLVSAVTSTTTIGRGLRVALLWTLLAAFLVITTAWMVRRGVKRPSQIGLSLLAFSAFATASDGPFQTLTWWLPLFSTLVIGVVAAALLAFKPSPLPEEDAATGT